jgi:acyl-coenzyme A synthetase/AMP-(fatty) acid ligase
MKIVRDREGMSKLRREIMQYVEKGINKFACTKEIKIVHDLPRTPTGKTVRQIIVEKGKPE